MSFQARANIGLLGDWDDQDGPLNGLEDPSSRAPEMLADDVRFALGGHHHEVDPVFGRVVIDRLVNAPFSDLPPDIEVCRVETL